MKKNWLFRVHTDFTTQTYRADDNEPVYGSLLNNPYSEKSEAFFVAQMLYFVSCLFLCLNWLISRFLPVRIVKFHVL